MTWSWCFPWRPCYDHALFNDDHDKVLQWSYHGEYESPWSYHVIAWLSCLTMAVNPGLQNWKIRPVWEKISPQWDLFSADFLRLWNIWFSALNCANSPLIYSESALLFTHGDQTMININLWYGKQKSFWANFIVIRSKKPMKNKASMYKWLTNCKVYKHCL